MKITGRIVEGNKLGRKLGYPTANIEVESSLDAANGVYAATLELDGRRLGAMANLGVRPTFQGGRQRILELHLLDFEGDLYGREVTAELGTFIRPERRFETPEELRDQIEKDEQQIKKILKCT